MFGKISRLFGDVAQLDQQRDRDLLNREQLALQRDLHADKIEANKRSKAYHENRGLIEALTSPQNQQQLAQDELARREKLNAIEEAKPFVQAQEDANKRDLAFEDELNFSLTDEQPKQPGTGSLLGNALLGTVDPTMGQGLAKLETETRAPTEHETRMSSLQETYDQRVKEDPYLRQALAQMPDVQMAQSGAQAKINRDTTRAEQSAAASEEISLRNESTIRDNRWTELDSIDENLSSITPESKPIEIRKSLVLISDSLNRIEPGLGDQIDLNPANYNQAYVGQVQELAEELKSQVGPRPIKDQTMPQELEAYSLAHFGKPFKQLSMAERQEVLKIVQTHRAERTPRTDIHLPGAEKPDAALELDRNPLIASVIKMGAGQDRARAIVDKEGGAILALDRQFQRIDELLGPESKFAKTQGNVAALLPGLEGANKPGYDREQAKNRIVSEFTVMFQGALQKEEIERAMLMFPGVLDNNKDTTKDFVEFLQGQALQRVELSSPNVVLAIRNAPPEMVKKLYRDYPAVVGFLRPKEALPLQLESAKNKLLRKKK